MTDKEAVKPDHLCADGLPANIGDEVLIEDVDEGKVWTVKKIRGCQVLLSCGDWLTWEYPEKLIHKKSEVSCENIQPEDDEMKESEDTDFIDAVSDYLCIHTPITPIQLYNIHVGLKYALYEKKDAHKCARCLGRAIFGVLKEDE